MGYRLVTLTQSHYPDTKPTSPCPILTMLIAWLRSGKYKSLRHWSDSTMVWTHDARILRSPQRGDWRATHSAILSGFLWYSAGDTVTLRPLPLLTLLPPDLNNYYRYQGSDTMPPCAESVTWSVFFNYIDISHRQVSSVWQVLPGNQLSIIRCLSKPGDYQITSVSW